VGKHLAQDLTGEVRLEVGGVVEDIPGGLTEGEEWEAIRRMQGREVKPALVEWLMGMATWRTKFDLTVESVAHPERVEKAVRRLLGRVCPGSLAVVGYERQERWSCHAHAVGEAGVDQEAAEEVWNAIAGFCRVREVRDQEEAVRYVLKHAVKEMDVEVLKVVPVFREEWVMKGGKLRPVVRVQYVDAIDGRGAPG
jgi:hypothetical protein